MLVTVSIKWSVEGFSVLHINMDGEGWEIAYSSDMAIVSTDLRAMGLELVTKSDASSVNGSLYFTQVWA